MLYFKRKKYIRLIKLTREKLDKIQKTINNFYRGIDIIVRNTRTTTNKKITISHSLAEINRVFRIKLFEDWNTFYYFEKTLEKIGLTKSTLKAYLHGFLNTYYFEQKESSLINILKEYTIILKNLNNEPVEFKCWKCDERVYIIEKNVEYPLKCPKCNHSPMYVEYNNIKYCRE